jgi:hypothetical protein
LTAGLVTRKYTFLLIFLALANLPFLRYKVLAYVRPQPSDVGEDRARGWFGWERVRLRHRIACRTQGYQQQADAMKVKELIKELERFPPETEVEIYAGKCCDVQPIHRVYFNPGGAESPVVVLVD